MLRFSTINKEESAGGKDKKKESTRRSDELQEAHLLQSYKEALSCQLHKNYQKACETFDAILQHPLLAERGDAGDDLDAAAARIRSAATDTLPTSASAAPAPLSHKRATLKYLSLKNRGDALYSYGDTARALRSYAVAADLHGGKFAETDVVFWSTFGRTALQDQNLGLAKYAFEVRYGDTCVIWGDALVGVVCNLYWIFCIYVYVVYCTAGRGMQRRGPSVHRRVGRHVRPHRQLLAGYAGRGECIHRCAFKAIRSSFYLSRQCFVR